MKPSEEIVRFFEKDRFAAETGAVIDEIDDRYARYSLTLEAKHKNALGAVMGGVYFTLADFAFAVASNWQGGRYNGIIELTDCLSWSGKREYVDCRSSLFKRRQDNGVL